MFIAAMLLSTLLPQAAAGQRAAVVPAMQVRPAPDEAVRRQARLTAGLAPTAQAKIAAASQSLRQRVRALPAASAMQLQGAARAATVQAFPGMQGGDLDTLVFLVLSGAAREQEADLQQQMSQMQQQMAKKKAQRDSVDSMNEMGEMQQMELQTLMEQRSKMLEALSDTMKSASDTQSDIIKNMK